MRPGGHAAGEVADLVGPDAVGHALAPLGGDGPGAAEAHHQVGRLQLHVGDLAHRDRVRDNAHPPLGVRAAIDEEDRVFRGLHLSHRGGLGPGVALGDVRRKLQQSVVPPVVQLGDAGLRHELRSQLEVAERHGGRRPLPAQQEVVGKALQQLRHTELHRPQDAPRRLPDVAADLGNEQRPRRRGEQQPRDLLQGLLYRGHLGELAHHLQRLPSRDALHDAAGAGRRLAATLGGWRTTGRDLRLF
mmetsp:Transcript_14571/g.39932  ORF Transcript_14571/g.39932 Transcript_14571/m.39932 type:complete len:245 (-) Transcript_14571:352-1086(-)